MAKKTANLSAYHNQWQKEHYDRINLIVPKGKKDIIQDHAFWHRESMVAFINRAIDEAMERDMEKE